MTRAYLDDQEILRLEGAAGYARDKLLIRLLSHLGCRVSEALALQVEDIDFKAGTVTIQQVKTRIKLACQKCNAGLGRSHSFCPKCGERIEGATAREQEHRRMRTLPLDKDTLEMLKDYIKGGGPVEKDGKQLIFNISRHRAWQIVKVCAEKAGLPKLVNPETGRVHNVTPHRLRDALAVRAMKRDDSGDGLRLLQKHLGHSSSNSTAKYRKVAGEESREWYHKVWPEEDGSDGNKAQ